MKCALHSLMYTLYKVLCDLFYIERQGQLLAIRHICGFLRSMAVRDGYSLCTYECGVCNALNCNDKSSTGLFI